MSDRQRTARFALAVVMALIAVALVRSPISAKSYHFTDVNIEATILGNGDLHIIESRTVVFEGSFSELWYTIGLTGSDGVADLEVYDSGRRLTESASEAVGTYKTEKKRDALTVRVFHDSSNEQRTFTFDYKLKNVIVAHKDTAELNWKFIGEGWDVPTARVKIEIFFPANVTSEDIRVWAHGPLNGEITLTDTPSALLTVDYLPPATFVEGRTTFPASSVPAARRMSNRNALDSILAEETKWAERSNELREYVRRQVERGEPVDLGAYERELKLSQQPSWLRWLAANNLPVGLCLLALALAVYLVLHFKYGKEFKPEFDGDYYRELPADYSPAVLGVLWRFGSPDTEDLTAEIMNLARRGYLRIVEKRTERKRALGLLGTVTETDYIIEKTQKLDDNSKLLPYEQELVDFLFALGSKESVSFDQITEYASKHSGASTNRFNEWKASVEAYAEQFDFFDREVNKGKAIGVLSGLAIAGLGVPLIVTVSPYAAPLGGIVGVASGVLLLILSAVMNRRSQRGATEMRMWQAFRKFLLDFSSLDEATIPSLAVWEHYLVYAVTLGVAKEVISQLPIVFAELRDDPSRFGRTWLILSTLDSTPAQAFDRLSSLTSTMNQVMVQAIAQSSQSSGAGRGGGFSIGGGGGGGGTGGGAR